MTISSPTNRAVYSGPGNGFAYSFPVFADSEIYVEILTDADALIVPVLNGAGTYDFTISGTFSASKFRYISGVTITLNNALPAGYAIVIENRVSPIQETDYIVGGPIPAERLETDLDRLAVMAQAPNTIYNDLIRVAPAADIAVPALIPSALKFLRWNATADAIETIEISDVGTKTFPLTEADIGDGTISTVKIQGNAVTLAKLQQIASGTFLGRNSSGSGNVEGVTVHQILDKVGTTDGGILYNSGPTSWALLAPGSEGQVLSVSSGVPSWGTVPSAEPFVAKVWGYVSYSGGIPTLNSPDYGVASVTDTAVGRLTVTFDTAFSTASYSPVVGIDDVADAVPHAAAYATGSFVCSARNSGGAQVDPPAFTFHIFGVQ